MACCHHFQVANSTTYDSTKNDTKVRNYQVSRLRQIVVSASFKAPHMKIGILSSKGLCGAGAV